MNAYLLTLMLALGAIGCSSSPPTAPRPDLSSSSYDMAKILVPDGSSTQCTAVKDDCTSAVPCCGAEDICSLRGARDFTQCCGPVGGACTAFVDCCGAMACDDGTKKCIAQASGMPCMNDADCVSNQCMRAGVASDQYGVCN